VEDSSEVDGAAARLARLEEELRCARSELKALQQQRLVEQELMEAKQSRLESVLLELRPCNWKDTAPERLQNQQETQSWAQPVATGVAADNALCCREERPESPWTTAQGLSTRDLSPRENTETLAASSGDALAALAAVWSRDPCEAAAASGPFSCGQGEVPPAAASMCQTFARSVQLEADADSHAPAVGTNIPAIEPSGSRPETSQSAEVATASNPEEVDEPISDAEISVAGATPLAERNPEEVEGPPDFGAELRSDVSNVVVAPVVSIEINPEEVDERAESAMPNEEAIQPGPVITDEVLLNESNPEEVEDGLAVDALPAEVDDHPEQADSPTFEEGQQADINPEEVDGSVSDPVDEGTLPGSVRSGILPSQSNPEEVDGSALAPVPVEVGEGSMAQGELEEEGSAPETAHRADSGQSEAADGSTAWVSTAVPNVLASDNDAEEDGEEDGEAAASAASVASADEAGESTARVSTTAPFPSRMMTDIASSESDLQEVASSASEAKVEADVKADDAQAPVAWPNAEDKEQGQRGSTMGPKCAHEMDHSGVQEAEVWPEAEHHAWPSFPEKGEEWPAHHEDGTGLQDPVQAWPAFPQETAAPSQPSQLESQCDKVDRLAACVERFSQEMHSKWSFLEDLNVRLTEVERSMQKLGLGPSASDVQLQRRLEVLEQQLEVVESQAAPDCEAEPKPSQDRGQHQVWL